MGVLGLGDGGIYPCVGVSLCMRMGPHRSVLPVMSSGQSAKGASGSSARAATVSADRLTSFLSPTTLQHIHQAASARPAAAASSARGLASLPGYVTSGPAVSTKKLSNGVSVAAEAGAGDLAVVSVWVDAGSRYEAPSLSGASNLLSRVALKGYEQEVAKLGGSVKAWTSREMTVVQASVLKADVAEAAALLGKVVTSPKFSDADVDAEKAAVLAELETKTTLAHDELLFEHLHATAFQDTPLAQPVSGTPETVAALSKSTLVDFMKSNFTGARMAVAGTGAVSPDTLVRGVHVRVRACLGRGLRNDDACRPCVPAHHTVYLSIFIHNTYAGLGRGLVARQLGIHLGPGRPRRALHVHGLRHPRALRLLPGTWISIIVDFVRMGAR